MKRRIFFNLCLLALLAVVLTTISVTTVLYMCMYEDLRQSVRDEALYAAQRLNEGDDSPLAKREAPFPRITLVGGDGLILYDSFITITEPLKRDLPVEIVEALADGEAESRRLSAVLSTQIYNYAIRLDDGRVVRVSGDMQSIYSMSLRYVPLLIFIAGAVVLLSALLARRQTKLITRPINAIDLERPLQNDVYEELSPLLRRLEHQRQELEERMQENMTNQREFAVITGNLHEGLILINERAVVLSINASARRMLGLGEMECTGRHILNVNRSDEVKYAVTKALNGVPGETVLTVGGRDYQLLASPVTHGIGVDGAVVLLVDITERRRSEQMRREFTANVSHELKTPLTSISGFAELIRDRVIPDEEAPAFAGRIHDEAKRLVNLVEDIIKLSRLDEQVEVEKEPVELLRLVAEVADRLLPQAEPLGLTIDVDGEQVEIQAIPQVLQEIIYNLCENAIKYNRPGGRVDIRVDVIGAEAVLSVADTGIGIPHEFQDKVFERFYRVDKSRSQNVKGTGLGLSIVKHGALLHNARLEIRSEPGEGTEIRVAFPLVADI